MTSLTPVLVILTAAFTAPLAVDVLARWVVLPGVVLEIALGVLIGPSGFGVVEETEVVTAASSMGLALLMFMAGYEIDMTRVTRGTLSRAGAAWAVTLGLGLGTAWVLVGWSHSTLIIGLALTTTAMGTMLPILRDSGVLGTGLGGRVLASGTMGEFAPIVVISLLLSGYRPLTGSLLLLAFFAVAALAVWRTVRGTPARVQRLVRVTLGTSAQLAVRLCLLIVVFMLWVSTELGLDSVLGSFAAGIIVRVMLLTHHPEEAAEVETRMTAVSYGLFIPVFFVVTGVRFDLEALASDWGAVVTVPLFVVLFLLVRGLPVWLLCRNGLNRHEGVALGLFASTALPLLVVLTTIGTRAGDMNTAHAAALVGAGMVSVLLFPQIGLALVGRERRRRESHAADE
ncbi:cation:proton antiporter [Nocardiopsis sp. NPDC049922]|uniref:cation:proton antiporter n=1 Tax=Nocardiopsis sp. NPDC049922 TaxID=3155157 RepID=UPI00341052FF